MREIIQVQLGQCGNQVGTRFWLDILEEHNLNHSGYKSKSSCANKSSETSNKYLECLDVYFNQMNDNRCVPRAVLIDMEASTIDNISSGPLKSFFNPKSFLSDASGAGNNWAKGHYTLGADFLAPVSEMIRREVEQCDQLQGMQLLYSLGGGTGGGFGSLILSHLREEYPDRIQSCFSIFPSATISNIVVEPYNAILATSYLVQNADAVQVLDNEALGEIVTKRLKKPNTNFEDFNRVISRVISSVTCSLRFSGQLNSDLRKFCVNLIPFPRLHFFTCSVAPLETSANLGERFKVKSQALVNDITNQLKDPAHFTCRHRTFSNAKIMGKLLTASVVYRGALSTKLIDEQLEKLLNNENITFVEWIPNCIKSCICPVSLTGTEVSALFMANSTILKHILQDFKNQFTAMLKKRAFLHWYTSEGLDEMEFYEAENDIADLIQEYEQHEQFNSITPEKK